MDCSELGESGAAVSVLSAPLLLGLRQAQAEFGLKHGDYKRYRQHCSKRLRKLYTSLKLHHGRGRFQKRELATAEQYSSEKHLQVPLMSAERAWATAFELKLQAEVVSSKRKHYMVLKLRKAVKWAGELARVANIRCSAKIALEAEAYSANMAGTLFIEEGWNLEGALMKFQRAQNIFQELLTGSVAGYEEQSVYRSYLTDLEPNIRFCRYKMERDSPQELGPTPISPNLSALKAKLSASNEPSTGLTDSAAVPAEKTFVWRGVTYQLNSKEVADNVASAEKLLADSKDSMDCEHIVAVLDKAIHLFNEACSTQNTLAASGPVSVGNEASQNLVTALKGRNLELQLRRGRYAVREAVSRLQLQQLRPLCGASVTAFGNLSDRSKSKGKHRTLTADDTVRMHEDIESQIAELSDLANNLPPIQSENLLEECSAMTEVAKAGSMLQVGSACLHRGNSTAAHAAAVKALTNCQTAKAILEYVACSDEVLEDLSIVQKHAAAMASLSVAEFHQSASPALEEFQLARLTLEGPVIQDSVGADNLAEIRQHWKAFAGNSKGQAKVYRQKAEPIPIRPFTLDAALNFVELPPLTPLYVKSSEQKSTFSRLFGW